VDCYVDTSAFYAYLVVEDRYHQPVAEYLTSAVAARRTLFSSSLVLGEILGLLQIRHGLEAAARFMADVYPLVMWRWVDRGMFEDIWRLVQSQGKRGFTVVDASAVFCVRERAGSVCVAVDEDLADFGFQVYPGA
jgi:predicted nucleic acid-binding protein